MTKPRDIRDPHHSTGRQPPEIGKGLLNARLPGGDRQAMAAVFTADLLIPRWWALSAAQVNAQQVQRCSIRTTQSRLKKLRLLSGINSVVRNRPGHERGCRVRMAIAVIMFNHSPLAPALTAKQVNNQLPLELRLSERTIRWHMQQIRQQPEHYRRLVSITNSVPLR